MFKRLQKIFPSLKTNITFEDTLSEDYQLFLTNENKVIGILQNELTDKDISILGAFLFPYDINLPTFTEAERKWNLAIKSETNTNLKIKGRYRFVYFSIHPNQIDPAIFKESIGELFSKEAPILWENTHKGIIIEEQENLEDTVSYDQIIDILMSDLYVNIRFFVGPLQEKLENVHQYYKSLCEAANTAFKYSNKKVVSYIEAIPFQLIDQLERSFLNDMVSIILKEFSKDIEMLKTIDTLFSCNLNVSVAAKELYMHRNSLQYRLTKFMDKTGLNPQNFAHAKIVYLALLAQKRLNM